MQNGSAQFRQAPAGHDMIVVDNVAKSFAGARGSTHVLSSLSFTCRPGEFVSLLGPSGCGKSTLLMLIAGLEQPSAGRIIVNGSPVEGPRQDIGVIFQEPTLLPWRSALDNVLFSIEMMRRPVHAYRDRAAALLAEVGLGRALDKRPHEMSGGMRQRVAICRALIHEPDILLMDEPFSALDAITRDNMNRLLSDLLQEHPKTVVLVTHSIREAVFLSDRVLVMGGRPGNIITTKPVGFTRPRSSQIEQFPDFTALSAQLRTAIETSMTGDMQ